MADENDDVLSSLNEGDDNISQDQTEGVSAEGRLGGEPPREDAPTKTDSIRDSIRKAIKHEAKTPEEKSEERNKNLEKAREVRKLGRTAKSDTEVDTNTAVDKSVSGKESVVKDVSTPKSDSQPPNGWTKEAKALWNQLPDDIKKSVAKREKEASDGFKTYGEKTKKYDELETVLAPRREAIQRFGVSEAQTVERLFQWMESLNGPNKLNNWLALGQNFGVDFNEVAKRFGSTQAASTTQQQSPQSQQQPATQIPDAVKQYVESAMGQVNDFAQRQRQEAANDYLGNWSKDKPHFPTVRVAMHGLLNSGAIPLKDGKLDLDTAYEYACYANPQVRSELESKAQEDAEKKSAEDRQKTEAERIIKVNNARKAGSSIKPTAPTVDGRARSNSKKNAGPTPSARDSIRDAISELLNQ